MPAIVTVAQPVELAFKFQLVAGFGEFGGRVHELVYPQETKTYPLATYRRLRSGGFGIWSSATLQLSIQHSTYTAAKHLQSRIGKYLEGLRAFWMGDPAIEEFCPVWVWHMQHMIQADGRDPRTDARIAISEILIQYRGN